MNRMPTAAARLQRTRGHMPPARRGVAMMLVLGVIVVAAVLGYAMLSHASLQKQISNNGSNTAAAQGMAESGVNLAAYYLQYPEKWKEYPSTYPETELYDRQAKYWTGTNDQFVDFGSPAIGSVKVTVTRSSPAIRWQYDVVSIGRAAGSSLERRVNATVYLNAEYKFEHAALFTNDVTLTGQTKLGVSGQNVGDVYSNGALIIRSGGIVLGRGTRRKVLATPVNPTSWQNPAPLVPKVVPLPDEIRNYQTYESPKGVSNTATVLTGVSQMGSPLGIPLQKFSPTTGNAAGIYFVPGDLTIKSGAEIDGTLIVQGNLNVEGTNVLIHSRDGFPALLVTGNITFSNLVASTMTVQGVTYVGGRIDAGGLIPTFNVNGALLVGGANPIFMSSPLAKMNIVLDATRAKIPDFTNVGRSPQSVSVLQWQGQ
jgi:hypothetical protein